MLGLKLGYGQKVRFDRIAVASIVFQRCKARVALALTSATDAASLSP
jgi:hypothetical protein